MTWWLSTNIPRLHSYRPNDLRGRVCQLSALRFGPPLAHPSGTLLATDRPWKRPGAPAAQEYPLPRTLRDTVHASLPSAPRMARCILLHPLRLRTCLMLALARTKSGGSSSGVEALNGATRPPNFTVDTQNTHAQPMLEVGVMVVMVLHTEGSEQECSSWPLMRPVHANFVPP